MAKVGKNVGKLATKQVAIAQKYQLHQNQISKWKTDFLGQALEYMNHHSKSSRPKDDIEKEQLYAKIGQLQVELDFLKKKLS